MAGPSHSRRFRDVGCESALPPKNRHRRLDRPRRKSAQERMSPCRRAQDSKRKRDAEKAPHCLTPSNPGRYWIWVAKLVPRVARGTGDAPARSQPFQRSNGSVA
jgi:hypothetical protein